MTAPTPKCKPNPRRDPIAERLPLDRSQHLTRSDQITAGRENGRCRPRGYDLTYRPHARTRVLLDQVREVLDEYQEHLPLTVRQVFYRLVGQHGYEKTEAAYARLAEALVRARRAKIIDFSMIRDDGVVTIVDTSYNGIEDFYDETGRRARRYRRDRQVGQQQFLELWSEASGMLGQLQRVAADFSVPVYSAGGFGSLTGNYQVAERALHRDVLTVILHVGDFDPSGESIFAAMTEDVAAFVAADRTIWTQRIIPQRIALTENQVDLYELDTTPPKRTDGRSRNWDGETCQLEALAPSLLAEIVRTSIRWWFDIGVYETQLRREADDRAELLALPPGAPS